MSRYVKILLPLVLVFGGCGADIDTTLDNTQRQLEPVVIAIERYQEEHGAYPDSLDLLVEDGFLDSIPEIRDAKGTLGSYPLQYQLSPDGSFYYMTFAYDFPDGIGPAELVTRYYISDQKKWDTSSFPPSFETLVAMKSGSIYLEKRSYDALKIAVEHLIKTTRGVNVFESLVHKCLGEGEAVELPVELRKSGDVVSVQYTSNDEHEPCYVIVFKKKVMPGMNKDGTISDREFEVARAIYSVTRSGDGTADWKTLAECR